MIDPELTTHLERIEQELTAFRKESNGLSANLLRGIAHGAGYVVGAALIITVIGWILNIVGIIPAFGDQISELRSMLESISKLQK